MGIAEFFFCVHLSEVEVNHGLYIKLFCFGVILKVFDFVLHFVKHLFFLIFMDFIELFDENGVSIVGILRFLLLKGVFYRITIFLLVFALARV